MKARTAYGQSVASFAHDFPGIGSVLMEGAYMHDSRTVIEMNGPGSSHQLRKVEAMN